MSVDQLTTRLARKGIPCSGISRICTVQYMHRLRLTGCEGLQELLQSKDHGVDFETRDTTTKAPTAAEHEHFWHSISSCVGVPSSLFGIFLKMLKMLHKGGDENGRRLGVNNETNVDNQAPSPQFLNGRRTNHGSSTSHDGARRGPFLKKERFAEETRRLFSALSHTHTNPTSTTLRHSCV